MGKIAAIDDDDMELVEIVGLNSRAGNYKQRYLIDNGLPGADVRGGLRTICVQGTRRKGFGEEQRVYRAQVGVGPGIQNRSRCGAEFLTFLLLVLLLLHYY